MFEHLFEFISNIISQTGYVGICFFMVLESMVFPIPSEAVMPFAGFLAAEGKFTFFGIAAASSLGSMIGSWLSYAIGLYGGRPFLNKFGKFFLLDNHHLDLTEKFFEKWGQQAVLISRFVPVVRHLISLPAGMARMNFVKFSIDTFLGATTWNMFLAFLGFKLQERWGIIKSYTHYLDYLVVLVLLIGVVYLYAKLIAKRKMQVKETNPQKETIEV
jgi:membrane protein DedA with SNARE-associated domain